tara:strand:+ start:1986 stop:3305 length:1320 start_codon:yes stop_codon:yes gene_type:complete
MAAEKSSTELAGAAPVASGQRISSLDTLRGVAVLGILVMNIYAFAMPFVAYQNPLVMGGTEIHNLATWFLTHIFFDQKFMSIFSMLFGAGIVLMMDRAEAKGAAFGPIFFRRQFWLLVLGMLHAYLIWFGDILFFYAAVGMLVFVFRHKSPRFLLITGSIMLLIGIGLSVMSSAYVEDLRTRAGALEARQLSGVALDEAELATVEEWAEFRDFMAPGPEQVREDVDTYRGGYPGIVAFRAPEVLMFHLQALPFFIVWRVGGLMLVGMALMKLNILSAQRDFSLYRRMLLVGYGLGLPLTVLSAFNAYAHDFDGVYMFGLGQVPNYFGSLLVAVGHIAAVMLLVKSGALRSLVARFSSVGQMALTNYLMHSLVMTTVFYGYGLGLYGEVPRLAQMGFVAALIGVQLVLSPWWLARYRFGPAEWLWRSMTYWRRQPMRNPG